MALLKSDAMEVYHNGQTPEEATQKPVLFSLDALLASEVPPDTEEDEELAENAPISQLEYNLTSNLPFPIGDQSLGLWASDTKKRQEEEDALTLAHHLADRQRRPKPSPTILKANDPAEFLARGVVPADSVMAHPRPGNGSLGASTGLRGLSGYREGISRSLGRWSLNAYATREKGYKFRQTFGANGRAKSDDVFGDFRARRDALRHQKQVGRGSPLSMLFVHGIRYNPSDAGMDQGFRTIIIPVPAEVTLEQLICEKLKGRGQILHAQMCDTMTIESTGRNKTAKIIFVTQPEWIHDKDELAKLSIIDDKPAYKVDSKTWPMSDKMIKDVARGNTRVIFLCDVPNLASMTTTQLRYELLRSTMHSSPCYYAFETEILSLQSDGKDRVAVAMNSITSAIGFLAWLQNQRHNDDMAEYKWEFGSETAMTDAELAQHADIISSTRAAQARGRTAPRFYEAYDGSPSPDSSPVDSDRGQDDAAIPKSADTSNLFSGPRANIPGLGFILSPAAAKSFPATNIFGYATFQSAHGSFYSDGMPDEERGPMYKKAAKQPSSDDEDKGDRGPGFVHRGGEGRGRPQTPGAIEVPKMGLWKSKSGVSWADDEDEDEEFGCQDFQDLEMISECVPPPLTPAPSPSKGGMNELVSADMKRMRALQERCVPCVGRGSLFSVGDPSIYVSAAGPTTPPRTAINTLAFAAHDMAKATDSVPTTDTHPMAHAHQISLIGSPQTQIFATSAGGLDELLDKVMATGGPFR